MKKILLLFILSGLISCEEVIEVDLNESEPKLVIEASINLLNDGTSNAYVKITRTYPYFDVEVPYVSNAEVRIIDDLGVVFPFDYLENGKYEGDLIPEIGRVYNLEVVLDGETFTGSQQLYSVANLDFVEQNNEGGFSGEDIELKAFFTDPEGVQNFYFFEGLSDKGDSRDAFWDNFFDGNVFFGFYSNEDISSGDEVVFNLFGVDEAFYNFMFTLLQQTGANNNGPFETQPATVRGNIINETNSEDFPLGYFRISEVSTLSYIVE